MMLSVNQNWDGCDYSYCVVAAVNKSLLDELRQRKTCANSSRTYGLVSVTFRSSDFHASVDDWQGALDNVIIAAFL